jgi:hypothetical protein
MIYSLREIRAYLCLLNASSVALLGQKDAFYTASVAAMRYMEYFCCPFGKKRGLIRHGRISEIECQNQVGCFAAASLWYLLFYIVPQAVGVDVY